MQMAKIRTLAGVSLAAVVAAFALAACGSGGSSADQAHSLLNQAFKTHPVNSGKLTFALAVDTSGSKTLKGPIALNFGGPFQSLGKGKTPKSDFTLRLSAFGRSGSLGIISTGAKGYVTLQGTSYQLPAATFRQFESGLAPVTRSGSLGKLPNVDFLSWIRNPVVVGQETVAGADTTHVRGGIHVHKMLTDLNSVIHKAPSAGSRAWAREFRPPPSPASQPKSAIPRLTCGSGPAITPCASSRSTSAYRSPGRTRPSWAGCARRTLR